MLCVLHWVGSGMEVQFNLIINFFYGVFQGDAKFMTSDKGIIN